MRRYWSSALVVAALLIGLLVTVAPLSQTEGRNPEYTYRNGCPVWEAEEKSYCPERYETLDTDKEEYGLGEEVKLTLSDLKDFEYFVEKVEVHFKPMFEHEYQLFYVAKDVGPIERDREKWVWAWDQTNTEGKQVGAGRFYIRITLSCCKNYRVYFRINRTGGTGEVQQPEGGGDEEMVGDLQTPNSPGNLGTQVLSSTEVRLTWNDNSDDEDGFRVYRNGTEIATVGANVTSFVDSGLEGGKNYNYQIASFNNSGESRLSSTQSVTTSIRASETPGALSSRILSPSKIRLTWEDNSDNEAGFRIYRNGSEIATVSANTTSFTDTGLASNTEYTYRVSSYNDGKESPLTDGLTVSTPVQVSVAPGNISSKILSPTRIRLTWNDNSDNEDGFRIYRNGKKIAELGPNTTSYVDTGLNEDTSYTYKISSYNKAGESSFSSGLELTTPVEVPSSPGQLKTETLSPSRIKLTWNDNSSNEDGFRIYRNGNTVATVGANTGSYIHKGLSGETRYCYQVVAYNSSGESGTTNRNCSMTLKSIPGVPRNVQATPLSSSEIKLSWKDWSDNEDGFRIYRNGTEIATLGPNTTGYLDTGLNPNSSYSYEIAAYNDSGESGLAGTGNVKTPAAEMAEKETTDSNQGQFNIGQRELLAGIGVVVMVMGYIYSEMG
ncbi:fibronectin type III domain-containing protein [Candidatus Bipolaricaulota bacterium]|nr:fibronectin type III domain-containing protein [Candidatus Bipolaricaulota bacterium]